MSAGTLSLISGGDQLAHLVETNFPFQNLDHLHNEEEREGESNYDEKDGADDHEVSTDPLTLLTGCNRAVGRLTDTTQDSPILSSLSASLSLDILSLRPRRFR